MSNVPVLRFPEFDGDWENKKLEVMGSFVGGGTPETSVQKYWEGDIPWLSSSDISDDDIHHYQTSRFITQEAIKNSATKIIPEKSVMFISRVGVGKLAISKTEICTSQDYTNLIPNNSDCYFIGYTFLSKNNLLVRYSQGTSIKGFTTKDLKSIKLNIPTLPEQQKIATFLSAVDKKLGYLRRKHALLESYKRGIMQKIFPSTGSGQARPELRFKQDASTSSAQARSKVAEPVEAFPDWEEKRLGDVATFKRGKGIAKSDISVDGAIPCIRYGELYTEYGEKITSVISKTNVNEKDLVLSNGNEVLIPSSGETAIDIATASCVLQKDVALGGDINILSTHEDGVFLAYYLKNYYKISIAKLGQGNSVVHLYAKDLSSLKMSIPSLEEQQKIANFLSTLDKKLEAVQKQIDQTETFKKGLLQKMFV